MPAPKGNKNAKGKATGRKSKYNKDFCETAYKLCLLGATDKDLADFFKVEEKTINNWKKDHIEFLQSINNGKEIADMEVAQSLYRGAIDRTIPKQQAIKVKEIIYENGKKVAEKERVEIVELEEVIPSDFRNAQFWLRNRKSDKWRDKQDVDVTTNGESINKPLSMEEAKARLEQLMSGKA